PVAPITTDKAEDPFEKIRKLAAMKAEGILTDEEFQKQKQRLLEQL
ncbi:MAG: Short C-terminal domain, partial [Bacteroidota bacterium]